jgi:signal transduction histidine kinase
VVRTLQDAVEIVRMSKKAKEHRFVTDVTGEIPLLRLVPDQMAQVFLNILLNAVDAMEGHPGEVKVRVSRDSRHVRVEIRDSGCGITKENMSKVFEPFFTTKQVGQGTGLGLWVSYGIVRSFRGDITVESEPGRGTVFTVILSRNEEEESPHG